MRTRPDRFCFRTFAVVALMTVTGLAPLVVEASPGSKGRSKKSGARDDAAPTSVAGAVEGRPGADGLVGLRWDPKTADVMLVLPAPDERGICGRYILVESLAAGLGSNPVGLDRGQIGRSRLVEFHKVGNRVWMEQPNLGFRAGSSDDAERAAVEQSFARSVLWSGEIVGEDPGGQLAVSWTSYLTSDVHEVADGLKRSGQGSFRIDPARSAVDLRGIHVFPDNVEIDVRVTWSGDEPGGEVRAVTPTPKDVSLVQHVSLVRLPDDGFRPRRFDPRSGAFAIEFGDYAVPLDAPLVRRLAVRHRLEPGEPLIYYVDPGVPEPVRGALVDGAAWWEEAFAAAGFPDTFRVEILPEGVHPLDVRYNVIQWVHRQTRGWSYGGGVVDPRTGEMIKGHVNLGSLRVRQDRLLFEALLGTDATGSGRPDDPIELALARIRQLSAHEVGHTLGLAHNFAASTYDGRASVMDYPAPWVTARDDGSLDTSTAYGVGVGSWDRQAIAWLYKEFPDAEREREGLEEILRRGEAAGRIYLTDSDARAAGSAHPKAHLWDNGADAVEELANVFAVRRAAMKRFGPNRLAAGRPLAQLEEVFVPLYLYHRYQLTAAARSIGGVDYRYANNGDRGSHPSRVPGERQRQAVAAVLRGLDPAELEIPEQTLRHLVPRPPGHPRNRETFRGRTAPLFDALAAATVAGELAFDELLEPHRAARLEEQRRLGHDGPDFGELLTRTAAVLNESPPGESMSRQGIREALQRRWVDRLQGLVREPEIDFRVRARAEEALARQAETMRGGSKDQRSLAASIDRFLKRDEAPGARVEQPVRRPPGSPIGAETNFGGGCGFSAP